MAGKVCSVWTGYFLSCPVRKLIQHPRKILAPYIKKDMEVVDVGCAMGFFGLPLARLVGPAGKVFCVDLQEEMIRSLQKRARKAGLFDRIETRVCSQNSLGLVDLKGQIDFALAFAVVHEVPDAGSFFEEIYETLKPAAKFLVSEPNGHVSQEDFEETISIANESGFETVSSPEIKSSRSVLLEKKS